MARARATLIEALRFVSGAGVDIATLALSEIAAITYAEPAKLNQTVVGAEERLDRLHDALVEYVNAISSVLYGVSESVDGALEASKPLGIATESCASAVANTLLDDLATKQAVFATIAILGVNTAAACAPVGLDAWQRIAGPVAAPACTHSLAGDLLLERPTGCRPLLQVHAAIKQSMQSALPWVPADRLARRTELGSRWWLPSRESPDAPARKIAESTVGSLGRVERETLALSWRLCSAHRRPAFHQALRELDALARLAGVSGPGGSTAGAGAKLPVLSGLLSMPSPPHAAPGALGTAGCGDGVASPVPLANEPPLQAAGSSASAPGAMSPMADGPPTPGSTPAADDDAAAGSSESDRSIGSGSASRGARSSVGDGGGRTTPALTPLRGSPLGRTPTRGSPSSPLGSAPGARARKGASAMELRRMVAGLSSPGGGGAAAYGTSESTGSPIGGQSAGGTPRREGGGQQQSKKKRKGKKKGKKGKG